MVSIKCHEAGSLLISTLTLHVPGFGTVDSGHLCLSGYNEAFVLLRRLVFCQHWNSSSGMKCTWLLRLSHNNCRIQLRICLFFPLIRLITQDTLAFFVFMSYQTHLCTVGAVSGCYERMWMCVASVMAWKSIVASISWTSMLMHRTVLSITLELLVHQLPIRVLDINKTCVRSAKMGRTAVAHVTQTFWSSNASSAMTSCLSCCQ